MFVFQILRNESKNKERREVLIIFFLSNVHHSLTTFDPHARALVLHLGPHMVSRSYVYELLPFPLCH